MDNFPRHFLIVAAVLALILGAGLATQAAGGTARAPAVTHLVLNEVDYDTVGADNREFVEVFLPEERGPLSEGRVIRQHLMTPACMALLTLRSDSARISRALRQYELALREWYLGGEWLALSHLYIAVETLTQAVIRKMTAEARGGATR